MSKMTEVYNDISIMNISKRDAEEVVKNKDKFDRLPLAEQKIVREAWVLTGDIGAVQAAWIGYRRGVAFGTGVENPEKLIETQTLLAEKVELEKDIARVQEQNKYLLNEIDKLGAELSEDRVRYQKRETDFIKRRDQKEAELNGEIGKIKVEYDGKLAEAERKHKEKEADHEKEYDTTKKDLENRLEDVIARNQDLLVASSKGLAEKDKRIEKLEDQIKTAEENGKAKAQKIYNAETKKLNEKHEENIKRIGEEQGKKFDDYKASMEQREKELDHRERLLTTDKKIESLIAEVEGEKKKNESLKATLNDEHADKIKLEGEKDRLEEKYVELETQSREIADELGRYQSIAQRIPGCVTKGTLGYKLDKEKYTALLKDIQDITRPKEAEEEALAEESRTAEPPKIPVAPLKITPSPRATILEKPKAEAPGERFEP